MQCTRDARTWLLSLIVFALALFAGPAAIAVPVTFTGTNGAGGMGVIGSAFVARSNIAHMNAFYSSNGTAGPYTELATPDAFDFTTGALLPPGTNPPPARQYGATATAPHGLASFGITGDMHIGLSGFTLDFNNASDLFTTSATSERRIYRNGSAIIVEETAPNTFSTLATFVNAVFTVDIDYTNGQITNTFTADRQVGSLSIFPELWTGSSFNPIDVDGSTANGLYGSFSVLTQMDVGVEVPAPVSALLALIGLAAIGRFRLMCPPRA